MPVAFTEQPAAPVPEFPRRKRWTRAECEFLDSLGFWENKHLELIDGELIDKMGKNRPHGLAVLAIHAWLISIFGVFRVLKEEPINVSPDDNPTSAPEPDLVVLREPSAHYKLEDPMPDDVLLLIEIADSTLSFDLSKKAQLYARAGIPDYWVVDILNRRFIVHREPVGGKYTALTMYREDESVAPLASPESEFRISEAFGS